MSMKQSIKSVNSSKVVNKTIAPKTFNNTITNVAEIQQPNDPPKPKSRFIRPEDKLSAVYINNKLSAYQLPQLNDSQHSEFQNFNVPPVMGLDGKPLLVKTPIKSHLYMDDNRIEYLRRQAQMLEQQIDIPDKIPTREYQVAAFVTPILIEIHEHQIHHHQDKIIQGDLVQMVAEEENIFALCNEGQSDQADFQIPADQTLIKAKLSYTPQQLNVDKFRVGRKNPQILEQITKTSESDQMIIKALYVEIVKIQELLKDNQSSYDYLSKELYKYSVVAITKQIMDKGYAKGLHKMTKLLNVMESNSANLNELISMTEGCNESYPEKSQTQMIAFIQQIHTANQKPIDRQVLLQVIYYSFLLFCKYQEMQEEQLIPISHFLIEFHYGVDCLNILYEFNINKIAKMKTKLRVINNLLNNILLPFNQNRSENERVLAQIFKYILKMNQRKQIIMKELLHTIFSEDQIQSFDAHAVLSTYIEYRNQIIRNPNKFTYELIKKKPLFIMQNYKLIFQARNQLDQYFYQLSTLDKMYKLYTQIPIIENQLIQSQANRTKIRLIQMQVEDQDSFRDCVVELRKVLDKLLILQTLFPNQFELLPLQLIRLREWVHTEVNQCLHLFKILNSKLHSIDVISNQMGEVEAQQLIEKSQTTLSMIQTLIEQEIPPHSFDKKHKSDRQDQAQAIKEIFNKYINEDEEIKLLKQVNLIDKCNQLISRLAHGRDSLLIKKTMSQLMSQLYTQLTEFTQKYQIWEHMNAARYLMQIQLLIDLIQNIQQAQQHTHAGHTYLTVIKKLQEQLSFFDVNHQSQGSQTFRAHLNDGITLLIYLKNNYEEYKVLALKNVQNPGTITIDAMIQELLNNVNNFLKVKNCTLAIYKEPILKAVQVYISQTKAQFEDSTKAAELDSKFTEAKTIEDETAEFIDTSSKKFDEIYQIGVEAVKTDAHKSKKAMAYDSFKLNLGYDPIIVQLRAKANEAYEQFVRYKEQLKLTSLPIYQQKLDQQLKESQSLRVTIEILEKVQYAVYLNSVDLVSKMEEVHSKLDTMLTMNSSQFILEILNQLETDSRKINDEIKTELLKSKINPKLEPLVGVVTDVTNNTIELLKMLSNLIGNFVEIYNGFSYFQDMINLLSEDFFLSINRWLTFFQSKPSDRTLIFSETLINCESRVEKLEKYPLIRMPCFKVIQLVSSIIHTYETEFNPDFMKSLSDFGQLYHTPGNKVQSFQEFQNELKFLLTPENNKDAVRQGLLAFYEKNKKAEVPLARMSQFLKAVQAVQKDERMRNQKRLKRLQNIEEIFLQMGSGQMDIWISMCKTMTNTLDIFLKNANEQKLQPLINYTEKIEESSRNLSNNELKSFVSKFLDMLKIDYNLSRF